MFVMPVMMIISGLVIYITCSEKMEGIMKKLIFIICLAMFMVTGCTSGNDNKPWQ